MKCIRHSPISFWLTIAIMLLAYGCFGLDEGCSPAGDIYLEAGSPLEIFCSVDPARENFSLNNAFSLVFYRNTERISSKYVTILNDTTGLLSVSNVTESDTYSCKIIDMADYKALQADEEKAIFNEELICTSQVIVGRKPAPIKDFSCLSYNWEMLNCSWTPARNDIDTTYRVQYVLPSRGGKNRSYYCPKDEDVQSNKCSWTLDSDPPYRRPFRYFTFIISGHNLWGDITQKVAFNHYSRLLPSPPQDLVVVNRTSSSIQLKWCIGVFCVFDDGVDYKIEYSNNDSNGDWNTKYYGGDEMDGYRDEVVFNVTNLKPNTAYKFRISMKVKTAEDPLWSLPAVVEAKTLPSVTQ